MTTRLDDASARSRAIDPTHSCLVRAPAGSGKTELLIQRFLALLGRVERPDAILAITFTRKAAAEMRERVMAALRQACQPLPSDAQPHLRATYALAAAVVERNTRYGWNLFEHPEQMLIQTIDSFNASLVARMPWLSRLGGLPAVSDHPRQLYRQAVRELVDQSGLGESVKQGLRQLLSHLDNRSDRLEDLLIQLLERRDQWLRHLFNDSARQREELQQALEAVLAEQLVQAQRSIPDVLRNELMVVGAFAAEQLAGSDKALCALAGTREFPEPVLVCLPLWQGLADLLLTGKGEWRKRCDKNGGFPADKKEPFVSMKQRMGKVLKALEDTEAQQLAAVSALPASGYSAGQWLTLQALLDVLPSLVAQLWLVFRQQGQVDFTEIALKARQSLIDSGQPTEQLLKLDRQLDHILIDEFQDTSWLQFELLATLVSGWNRDDGRTLFVVGDPMQSIYRFREAEVGLFLRAGQRGVADIRLESLQLNANFRSQQGVVDWLNQWFPQIFPRQEDAGSGAVSYSPAQAVHPVLPNAAVSVYPRLAADPQGEAQQVVALLEQLTTRQPGESVAVLVRSRTHLQAILPLLQQRGIAYQAQEIDALEQRPVVSDLVALVQALLHSADTLSWMTVLRAPWCGLSLAQLAVIAEQSGNTVSGLLGDDTAMARLPSALRQRLEGVAKVLIRTRRLRGQRSLRQLVEDCWIELDGPKCYDAAALTDAEQVFRLLEQLDHGGDLLSFDVFRERVQSLFAAMTGGNDDAVQVMTIHKAKGLEFDHVILPGLGRRPRGADQPLMRWLEHPLHGLLLAPITAPGDAPDPIYHLLGRLEKSKEEHEVARLLYVAVTRARRHLYLLGHARLDRNDQPQPAPGSLLATLWPAVCRDFSAAEPGEASAVTTASSVKLVRRAEPLGVDLAEEVTEQGLAPDFSLPSVATHIGTVTHAWLERFVRHPQWQEAFAADQQCSARIAAQLTALGVEAQALKSATERVHQLLSTTLASDRGRWILADHEQGHCEFALSGETDGLLIHTIVDRTFVEAGERWIVDYKTADPGTMARSQFYQQQRALYSSQLQRYAQLLGQLDPANPCRCALYFPACDGWCELNLSGE